MGKNAIVGQSGGPTSVINASLAGVFESCKNRGADVVYGMCNGVAGLLEERVVDLSTLLTDDLDIELLKRTPSSFLGSCRYKLPDWRDDEAVYKKLFAILEKLNIGYFFYIGGNDSMDTIGKLADYGNRVQSSIRFMGVPKTIDNDLMVTDHTPGYGSAAKYIGVVMKEIIRDATVYGTKYVTVVEIMGRNAGWLTAAAALAKSDDCEGVDMICLPEVPFNVDHFVEKVRVMQEKKPSIVIAVSEGVKLEDGRYVCELADDVHAVDAFGHKALTGTARFLANVVARNLDTKTRCIELSTLQRCAGHLPSRTDITEAYQVGGAAAKYIGVVMKEIIRDATVYGTKYVTVVEIMGRNAGWLTAAAALAKSDDCEGVDMICLPEVPFNVERFVEKVRVMQEKKPSIVIAVSEGVKLEDGRYVCELADDVHAVDAFGHKALTGTARYLANVVARNLDTKTRCIELSTLQRCAGHLTSRTDITEAYQVGGAAAKAAFEGVTGQMVALKRISNNPYQCTTELHPISEVANLEKKVPLSWMNNNHTQMTEDFLDYARPLIQAELTPLYIAGLPHHIYMKNQK